MTIVHTEVSAQVHYPVPYWIGGGKKASEEIGLVITSAEDGGPPFAIHDGPDTVELQGSCLTLQDAVRWCVEEYRKRHPGRLITLVREPGCVSSEVIYGLDDCRRGFVPPDALQLELPFPSVPTTDPHESV